MPFDRSAISAVLFDLDGTLIDSSADLSASGNWLRVAQGLAPLSAERIASYVGDGAEALVRRLLEIPDGDVAGPLDAFKRHYHEHCLDHTSLYPGVAATLEALQARGLALAVVTNKPEGSSRRILDGLGVGRRFGSVVGGNTCGHKKPHPEPLQHACGQLGHAAARSVMVGDSRVDVEAGRNAGAATIGLLGGIGDQGLLRAAAPDILLEHFERLIEVL